MLEIRPAILASVGLLWLAALSPASAQEDFAERRAECDAIDDPPAQLDCYRAIFNDASVAPPEPVITSWATGTETSPIDDSTNVFLSVDALEPHTDRYGNLYLPALVLVCRENVTALYIDFDGEFMADSGGFGTVTMRIDDAPAREVQMAESTNNLALGLWRGGLSIPVIRELLEAEELFVRATPFSESPRDMIFPVAGLDEVIDPLREACGW